MGSPTAAPIYWDECFPKVYRGLKLSGTAIIGFNPGISSVLNNTACPEQRLPAALYGEHNAILSKAHELQTGSRQSFYPFEGIVEVSGIIEIDQGTAYLKVMEISVLSDKSLKR